MFEEYSYIDDIMRDHPEVISGELNAADLYVKGAKEMGYTMLGLIVCNNDWKEKSRYCSHNEEGKIQYIQKGFQLSAPNICFRVKEDTLLSILSEISWVKSHPFRAFFKYAPGFRPARPARDTWELAKLTKLVTTLFNPGTYTKSTG